MSVVLDREPGAGRRAKGSMPEAREPASARGRVALARDPARGRRPPHGARVVVARPATVRDCGDRRPAWRWPALAALAVAVGACVLGFGLLAGAASPGVPEQTRLVTVAPEQTVWEVATEYAPASDPADVVRRIEELNGIRAGSVDAGIPLVVPVAAP